MIAQTVCLSIESPAPKTVRCTSNVPEAYCTRPGALAVKRSTASQALAPRCRRGADHGADYLQYICTTLAPATTRNSVTSQTLEPILTARVATATTASQSDAGVSLTTVISMSSPSANISTDNVVDTSAPSTYTTEKVTMVVTTSVTLAASHPRHSETTSHSMTSYVTSTKYAVSSWSALESSQQQSTTSPTKHNVSSSTTTASNI